MHLNHQRDKDLSKKWKQMNGAHYMNKAEIISGILVGSIIVIGLFALMGLL